MNYIPKKVRELFIKIFEQFSNTKDIGYKDVILGMAETEDEKKDLEELFHSTTDYYNEYQKVSENGKEPSEYLFEFYMEEWKKEIQMPQLRKKTMPSRSLRKSWNKVFLMQPKLLIKMVS